MSDGDPLDRRPVVERDRLYMLLVEFYKYHEKLDIDGAHAKVDAIYRYLKENGQ